VTSAHIIDYHVHESHSRDTTGATIQSLIKTAETKEVKEVAITSHLILEGKDMHLGVQINELDSYFKEIEEAQRDTEVRLRAGLEVDYFPSKERQIEAIIEEHPLDYVLGSTHYINGLDIGSRIEARGFFASRSLEEAADEYFSVWKEAIESGLFDVMAHPDYWRKFLHLARAEPATWNEYGVVVAEAIDSLVCYGVGVEVNTSATRHRLAEFYPVKEFLEAVHKAGVRRMTVGSDAHSPEVLGYMIPDAVRLLMELGFKHISTFKGRIDSALSLNSILA
jgi:histidinol-phosphatase (PHP family)